MPIHMPHDLRERTEAAIERLLDEAEKLILFLDMFDGDDLEWEHDGREPDDESNIVAVDGKQGLLGSEDGNLSVRQWRSQTSGRL
jgi:hypothetical protein